MANVKNIVLTKRSRDALSRKTENCVFENVAEQIEYGDWYLPWDETEFSKMRDLLVKDLRSFFSLSEEDPIEIKRFDSSIISFNGGIYPDYSVEEGDPDHSLYEDIDDDNDS